MIIAAAINGVFKSLGSIGVVSGNWSHFIATFNGVTWAIYIDNVLDRSLNKTDTSTWVGTPLLEIGSSTRYSTFFKGEQFDLRFDNKVYSANERLFLNTFGASGDDPGTPEAWYKMNDTDNTMRDSSGNGNDGNIINSTSGFYAFQNIHDYGDAP